MRVVVYNSVSGAAFFQGLIDAWRAAGVQVFVHSAVSEADYRAARGMTGRLWLRWRMYGGFAVRS